MQLQSSLVIIKVICGTQSEMLDEIAILSYLPIIICLKI